MNRFAISEIEYNVKSATLEPFFDDEEDELQDHRIVWGVQVRADGGGEFDWNPNFLSERLLETKPLEVASWKDLVGRNGSWGDDEDDEECATLYTFSHEPVLNVTWNFALAPSGKLAFSMKGVSAFNHPGGHKGLLPVVIEAELDYAPIPNGNLREARVRKQLKQYGLTDPFDFRVVDDVSCLFPKNYPATP